MANPNWILDLSEVLKHPTQQITKTSPNTGKEYTTDAIPQLVVLSTGSMEESDDGKFRYSIVDSENKLEYLIKTENKIDVKFGTQLIFKNVRGGMVSNTGRGWYAADSVQVAKQNA